VSEWSHLLIKFSTSLSFQSNWSIQNIIDFLIPIEYILQHHQKYAIIPFHQTHLIAIIIVKRLLIGIIAEA